MVVPNLAAVGDAHIGQIADLLGSVGIEILSMENGFVVCPGRDLHRGRNSDHDCRAWVNADTGAPAIFCFHTSCYEVCAKLNSRLREHILGRCRPRSITLAAAPATPAARDDGAIKAALAAILAAFRWPVDDIENDPCGRVHDHAELQWPYLVALFPDDAVVWIGRDEYDTGKPGHRYRFRTAREWLRLGKQPGVYICPNRFIPGCYSRSNVNVARRDFLVVESDKLSRDEVGAIFRWIEAAFPEARLRAVVVPAEGACTAGSSTPPTAP